MKQIYGDLLRALVLLTAALLNSLALSQPSDIPLPEHPRPDFQREHWLNLNGTWDFRFDPENRGLTEKWYSGETAFPGRIVVPFSWAAPLSGQTDAADIGWYRRTVMIPADLAGQRLFLVIGS